MAIDATIAGENSNSYITLDEANEYAAERGHADWEDLDDEESISIEEPKTQESLNSN